MLKALLALCVSSTVVPKLLRAQDGSMIRRSIPSTGETVPVIGLGTWQTFSLAQRVSSTAVLQRFVELGGELIDTSPMYSDAERAIGVIASELGVLNELFVATKVWTRGEATGRKEIAQSSGYLKKKPIDLYQVHNLVDWKTQLKTLRELKEKGDIRYIGITHYVTGSHNDLERIVRSEKIDFIQVNYNMGVRNAENSLLPAAQDRGVAVLVNRPYATGALFRRTRGQDLPGWAAEIGCDSFGQIFLKYILSHPAVTCIIPATSKVHHLEDNLGAATAMLPDASQRKRMVEWYNSL